MDNSRGPRHPLPFSGPLRSALGPRGRPQLRFSSKPVCCVDKWPRVIGRRASGRTLAGLEKPWTTSQTA